MVKLWALVLVVVIVPTLIADPPSARSDVTVVEMAADRAERVLATLDSNEHDVLIYAARSGLALSSMCDRGALAAGHDRLNRLWNSRYVDSHGRPGFGLPEATDAFQDGSISPRDTIYTYTSSMAALAFLDGYEVYRDSAYLRRARATIETLLAPGIRNSDGLLRYSNHPNDSQIVWNVNALALAALARFDRLTGGARYAAERAALTRGIDEAQNLDGSWPYWVGDHRGEDLLHHAFMVAGVVEAGSAAAPAAISRLRAFYRPDGSFDRKSTEVMGTRGWGPAEGLSALVLADEQFAQTVVWWIAAMVDDAGAVNGVEGGRAAARYALALAQYAARHVDDHPVSVSLASGRAGQVPRCTARSHRRM